MKVKELIELLSQYPEDMKVTFEGGNPDWPTTIEVHSLSVKKERSWVLNKSEEVVSLDGY